MQYSSLEKLNSPLAHLLIKNPGHFQPFSPFGQRKSYVLSTTIKVDVIVTLSYIPSRYQF